MFPNIYGKEGYTDLNIRSPLMEMRAYQSILNACTENIYPDTQPCIVSINSNYSVTWSQQSLAIVVTNKHTLKYTLMQTIIK